MRKKFFLVFISLVFFLSAYIYVEKVKAYLPGGPGNYCWVESGSGEYGIWFCDTPRCDNAGPPIKWCAYHTIPE